MGMSKDATPTPLGRLIKLVIAGFMVDVLLTATVFHDTQVGILLYTLIILGVVVVGSVDLWANALRRKAG